MRVLILDAIPKRHFRISKDTNGGFGTGNDYGDTLVARALRWLVARNVDWPPMYAAYTASVLRDQGHEVIFSRDPETVVDADLCLLTSSIVAHETELELVRRMRARGIPVGAIGPFAASVAQPYIDAGAFVIGGEPEMFFLRTPIDESSVREFVGLVPGKSAGLDDLPLPAWDLIHDGHAPRFNLLANDASVLPIAATRGCPYSCFHYCVYPLQQGRKVRLRDPANIVAEMAHWQDTLGVSMFIFRDPVFSINRKHTLALCDALRDSGRRFSFIVETHLNNIDEELARRLSEVGLVMAKVGIESAEPEVMDDAKRFTIADNEQEKRIRMLESFGIGVTCMFIFGYPGDTRETCRSTIAFAKKLNTAMAQFSVFTPYPGTPAYPEFQNRITAGRYEDFNQWRLVFRHDVLSPSDIRELLGIAFRDYYLRPTWMWKYLKSRLNSQKSAKRPMTRIAASPGREAA
jgi:radical SAM superfamily enzyme YgiQ (UPF0313 family)